jgi:biopolymer transport protein ExbD
LINKQEGWVMRFKNRQRGSQLPEVNLVPMMDVLMTVLTFFIIISMTLTGQQILNVTLPQVGEEGANGDALPDATFVVGLDANGQILLNNQLVSAEQLVQEVQAFLSTNPEGIVLLKADRTLNYDQVAENLRTLRNIGGDRVSLAIERN